MMAQDLELRQRLTTALNVLPIKPDEKWRVPLLVVWLANFAAVKPRTPSEVPAFRKIGRTASKREVNALIAAAKAGKLREAQRALNALHEPSIDALARVGVVRQQLTCAMLPSVAARSRRAKLGRIPKPQTRQRSAADRYIAALADALANTYFSLVGERPTLQTRARIGTTSLRPGRPPKGSLSAPANESCGPFHDLVRGVFTGLEIKRSAIAAARSAVKRFKEAQPQARED